MEPILQTPRKSRADQIKWGRRERRRCWVVSQFEFLAGIIGSQRTRKAGPAAASSRSQKPLTSPWVVGVGEMAGRFAITYRALSFMRKSPHFPFA
jgi:hypothetical protein